MRLAQRDLHLAAAMLHLVAVVAVCAQQSLTTLRGGRTAEVPSSPDTGPAKRYNGPKTSNGPLAVLDALAKTYLHGAGIQTGYGFFAPNVPVGFRLIIDLHRRDGRVESTEVSAAGGELGLRVASFLDALGRTGSGEIRNVMFASIARSVLEAHPDTTRINLVLEKVKTPSLQEYRNKNAATYEPICVYEFAQDVGAQATPL